MLVPVEVVCPPLAITIKIGEFRDQDMRERVPEIFDIDMGRWMAKSVAWVVHADGRRLKLDDYLHRNVHLIVGALASERYPDEWDAEAKRVGAGEEAGEAEASAAGAEASGPEG